MLKTWKTIKNKNGEEYDVLLIFNEKGGVTKESSCPCMWGSFHRWSKQNRDMKWMCRHVIKAYAQATKKSYSTAREVLIKQGLLHESHLKKE